MIRIHINTSRFNAFHDEPAVADVKQPDVKQPDVKQPDVKQFSPEYVQDLETKVKKFEELYTATQRDLEGLKTKSALTAKDREALTQRISDLEDARLTEKELAEKQKNNLEKKYKADLDKAQEETTVFRNLFFDTVIQQELLSAVTDPEHKAYNPEQLVSILKPVTKITQKTDAQGNLIPEFEVKVKVKSVDKEGKPIELTLSPKEAVSTLYKQEENANLFVFNGSTGAGFKHTQTAGSLKDITMEEYAKGRLKGTISL
jgi:hypothetical protein